MNVSISAITFDLSGEVTFTPLPGSSYGNLARRANKVATTDGGVAVNDFGFSDGDREFLFILEPTEGERGRIEGIVRNYSQVNVATENGFYRAIPEYEHEGKRGTLTLSITEKLSAD